MGAFVLAFVLGPPSAAPSIAVPLARSFVPFVVTVGSAAAAPDQTRSMTDRELWEILDKQR